MDGQTSMAERVKSLLQIIDSSLADEEYNNMKLGLEAGKRCTQEIRQELAAVAPLMLAAPDLLAVLAALLNSTELNYTDMEEHTLRLCARAYKVLEQATGERMDDMRKLRAIAYQPAADATVCQVCQEDRTTDGAETCCYCGHSYDHPTTEREAVLA